MWVGKQTLPFYVVAKENPHLYPAGVCWENPPWVPLHVCFVIRSMFNRETISYQKNKR